MVRPTKYCRPRSRKGRYGRLERSHSPCSTRWVFVAGEMERRGFDLPLLIGGATTSRRNGGENRTAYHNPTVHVFDGSRAVDVCRRC